MKGSLAKEIGKRGPFESLEQEVFLNLVRTADVLTRGITMFLKASNLSPTQYNVLRILRGSAPAGLGCQEIAAHMITRDPDLTRLLDRLEKQSLISRQRQTDDRRVVRTTITDAGLKILSDLDQPLLDRHHQLLGHLGAERLQALGELLEEARKSVPPSNSH
jgi:DNA-binding MarR family transcriptional regulator